MSAIVNFDTEKEEIVISAHLVFYGKYAEKNLGEKIINEINTLWNEPKTVYTKNDKDFIVKFEVDFECMENEQVTKMMLTNQDFSTIFIRIEDQNVSERSMMGFGLGENSGHWLITDNLGESTTAAHEFGHALGLPHPVQLDYRNMGTPPIMAPRGTIVDAKYQWNPSAEAGQYGGTMKPIYRQVKDYEVLAILENYSNKKAAGSYALGSIHNRLFDEMGRPVELIIT